MLISTKLLNPIRFKIGFHNDTLSQTDSSTIDGNVEFVHSQYSCIFMSHSVRQNY